MIMKPIGEQDGRIIRMAKDPAFLFYPSDWISGTMYFNFEQKGAYFELLMLQFNKGKFTETQAQHVLNICYSYVWPVIKEKFQNDGEFYWNERLDIEKEKRKSFCDSRKANKTAKNNVTYDITYEKHMMQHMENENINRIVSDTIDYLILKSGKIFKKTASKNITVITARVKEKYTLDDFKKVIDSKCSSWLKDPKMIEYLRPETLFGPKFDGYLANCTKIVQLDPQAPAVPMTDEEYEEYVRPKAKLNGNI